MTRLYIVLLALLCAVSARAEIIINDLDITNYPAVKGNFFYYNNTAFPVYNLSHGQVVVFDNGVEATVTNFVVPQAQNIEKISAGIVVDLAIAEANKFAVAKQFAGEFAELFPETGGQLAVMSLDQIPYLNCAFTNDKSKLLAAVNLLASKPTSAIENGFNVEPGGVTDIIKRGEYEKSVIFVSDGNKEIETTTLILLARAAGIKINCVTLDEFASDAMKQIAEETGGIVVENLNATNYKQYAKLLVSSMFNYKPIEIEWTNNLDCEDIHNIEFIIESRRDTGRYALSVPDLSKPTLKIDPSYLKFGAVIPGENKDLDLYLTAQNSSIEIKNISVAGVDFSIVSGYNPGESMLIPRDETRSIKVRFSPTDSNIVFAVLNIESNACFGKEVYLNGGFPNRPPKTKTINITNPNNGEILVAGDTCGIRWHGMLPSDVIQLEYTVDNGTVWDTLAQDVQGLEYIWDVPLYTGTKHDGKSTISDQCLARIIQLWPNNVGQTLDFPHGKTVLSANFTKSDGTFVVTASEDGMVKVWNSYTGAAVMTLKREGSNATPEWANFNDAEDKVVAGYSDGVVIICDKETGNVLQQFKAHDNSVACVNFNHAGDKIVSVGWDNKINIWNIADARLLVTFDNSTKVWSCEFMKDDNRIIFSDNKGKAKVFNTTTREIEKEFYNSDYNLKVNNIAINSAETMVATSQQDGKASVWDFNTGERLFQVTHGEVYLINYIEFGLDPTTNQELIITSCSDYTARTWSALNGESVAVLREHNNSVSMACFNFDGSRILSASMDSTAKVWNLNKRDLQMDTTDVNFSIVRAELEGYPIEIAKTAIDEIRYVTVDSVMKNVIKTSFPIRGMYISGANADEFTITEGEAPYRIDSNEVRGLSLAFAPKAVGNRTATLNVVIPYDTLHIPINGEGYEVGIQLMVSSVDFGQVEIGDFKDQTVEAVIKNRTSGKVKINSVANVGPVQEVFDILSTINNVELDAWATMPITLRFYAAELGRQQGVLQFDYDFTGSPALLSLYGEGVEPVTNKIVLTAPERSAAPGEEFSLPIYVNRDGEFNIKATGIATELAFNPSLLEVLDKSLQVEYIDSRLAKVYLSMPSYFSNEEIYSLQFRAGLGNDTACTLHFENTSVIGNDRLEIQTNDSRFNLNGLCTEGGNRLIDSYSKYMLSQPTPNPAIATAKIQIEVPAACNAKLYVSNIRGEVVLTALDGEISAGTHSIDLNVAKLPSGTYIYTLETPYWHESRRLEIVK